MFLCISFNAARNLYLASESGDLGQAADLISVGCIAWPVADPVRFLMITPRLQLASNKYWGIVFEALLELASDFGANLKPTPTRLQIRFPNTGLKPVSSRLQ